MKFSLFILPSWPEESPGEQGRILGEAVEQIQFAEELGFDSVWLAEHHFCRYGIVPNSVTMGMYVAAKTKTIRIATGVSVLTFRNPIHMAEETALLDALSGGRLDFGVGRGQVVYEYNNFKVEYDSRSQRFEEMVDIITGLWTTTGFSYQGQYYSVEDITIAPTPVQKPHPPLYIAVSKTPASIDFAVERDLPVLTSPTLPEADNLGIVHDYYDRCAAAGKTPLVEQMPYFRLVYVGEDGKQAVEEARDPMTWVYDLNGLRRTLKGGSEIYMDLDHWKRTRPQQPLTYEEHLTKTAYIGDPDHVVNNIERLRDEHNVRYFGVDMSFGGLAHDKVMRSMELFAKEVMPRFK